MSACLMLHGIGPAPERLDPDERSYWISERAFAFVLDEVQAHGARLTIDDGNDTDARIAMPMLMEAGLKASFFIPSDRIGTPGYVTEADIHDMHDAGMEIGSHGCAHLNWLNASDAEIAGFERAGGVYRAGSRVDLIVPRDGGFRQSGSHPRRILRAPFRRGTPGPPRLV